MIKAKHVTIMLIPDGSESRRGVRIPTWLLKVAIGFQVVMIIGIILFFIFYGRVVTRAAMADRLAEENEQLLRYQYKVKLLEENLIQVREIVTSMTHLAGIDFEFPELPDDSTLFASLDQRAGATLERSTGTDLTIPAGMPLPGFVSQDFRLETDQYHPGIDIACAIGTPVLATASGTVVFASVDSTYGKMVVVQHNDSTITLYGHNDSLLVRSGDRVQAGSRVALSGNTGKSSAPHLHYEIRIRNQPINPMEK